MATGDVDNPRRDLCSRPMSSRIRPVLRLVGQSAEPMTMDVEGYGVRKVAVNTESPPLFARE